MRRLVHREARVAILVVLTLAGAGCTAFPILPEEWVRESTRGHVPETPTPQFGWHWWTDDEAGASYVDGIRGQYLYVDLENRVVIAMFRRCYSRIDEDVFRDLAAFVGRS